MTDVLEDLDRARADMPRWQREIVKRACDEIAVLRQEIEDFAASMPARMNELNIAVRAKALEEAAQACETIPTAKDSGLPFGSAYIYDAARDRCATAIRALKVE